MQFVEAGPSEGSKPTQRSYRSRRSRPCDRCRKGKQLCLINVDGEPCGGCVARKQSCTFDIPPLRRHNKGKSSELSTLDYVPNSKPIDETAKLGHIGHMMGRSSEEQELLSGIMAETWPLQNTMSTSQMPTFQTGRPRSVTLASGICPPWSGANADPNEILSESDIWQTLFRPHDTVTNDYVETNPISLDLEAIDDVESHFLGTGTFRGLTLREISNATSTIPNQPGMVHFRQVSADASNPVYFVRHPSLQYGEAPENGKAAWDKVTSLCAHLGNGTLVQALSILRTTLLHALPIINYPQFEQACKGAEGAGPVPYALLAATLAHSASYIADLRPLHQPLWAHVLNGLDAEFRQPRLQTLQLSMLLLSSRPGVNFAQSDITLSRTIGAVHVLGLHLDPSQWSLPRWERSLRTRLFWTVLYHDKFRALLLGRPSQLHEDNYSTPIPSIDELRWVEEAGPIVLEEGHRISLEAFIANCRLVPIIDILLKGFMTVKSVHAPRTYLSRVLVLDSIRAGLNTLEETLPDTLKKTSIDQHILSPTGVRSFQLTLLGLKCIVHRIELDILDPNCSPHILSTVLHSAAGAASGVVQLILGLTVSDRTMFWIPYTFHHMSNAGSLLLRVAAECHTSDPALSDQALDLAKTYCLRLVSHFKDEQWDMADETLKRLAEPAFAVGKECPLAREIYIIISNALGYHVADTAWDDHTASHHFGFINDGFDPSVWTVDGVPWLSI